MFKGKIVSRTNINGKVHSFQKDFDDYDSYQEFLSAHPEYNQNLFENFNPWRVWDYVLGSGTPQHLPLTDTKYLPEGVDLTKYEQRREEKRQKAQEDATKRRALEMSKSYLEEYIAENTNDEEAQNDLKKVEGELKNLTN